MSEGDDRALLTHAPHPLLGGREQHVLPPGCTIAEAIRPLTPAHAMGVVVVLNGKTVLPGDWATTKVHAGDVLVARCALHGDEGGSNPLTAILAIALVALPALLPVGLTAALGTFGTAILKGVIGIAGNFLIGALNRPEKPQLPTVQANVNVSPTYSLQGGRNAPRAYAPLPIVMGRHKLVPDLSAQPWTYFESGEQYLQMIYCFGLGYHEISDLKIGNTPLASYKDAEQSIGLDGNVVGAWDNVDTIEGSVLDYDEGWSERRTPDDVIKISVDLVAQLYTVDLNTGDVTANVVDVEVQYRKVGETVWQPFFTGNASVLVRYEYRWLAGRNTAGVWFTVEYGSTNPDAYIEGQVHRPPSCFRSGDAEVLICEPATYWSWRYSPSEQRVYGPVEFLQLSHDKREPLRQTHSRDVEIGQYEIRYRKRSQNEPSGNKVADVTLSAIRAFQQDAGDYEHQTRLGLRIRATGQLQGVVDELSATVQAYAPTTIVRDDPPQPTSNPAWWFLFFLRGKLDTQGRRMYGALLGDDQIDLQSIEGWASYCDTNDLRIDFVLDQPLQVSEVLQLIAGVGRAIVTWSSGKIGVVYPQASDQPVAVYGMPNIRAGSFGVEYISERMGEEIIATYLDETDEYRPHKIVVKRPGVEYPESTVEVELPGITRQAQAAKAVNMLMASQIYHRRRITFETDAEGFVCQRGDVIVLSHDMTTWHESGRVVRVIDQVDVEIEISRPIDVPSFGEKNITFRFPTGEVETVDIAPAFSGGGVTEITLANAPTTPWPSEPRDVVFVYGAVETPGKLARIVEIRPRAETQIAIECIDEDPAYFAAETGDFEDVAAPPLTPPQGRVSNLRADQELTRVQRSEVRVQVTWDLFNAGRAWVRVAIGGGEFEDMGVHTTSFSHIVRVDTRVRYEVQAIRVNQGAGYMERINDRTGPASYIEVLAGDVIPNDVVEFTVTRESNRIRASWTPTANAQQYEIRKGDEWGVALYVGRTVDVYLDFDDPAAGTILIKAVGPTNRYSLNASSATYTAKTLTWLYNESDGKSGTYDDTEWDATNGLQLLPNEVIADLTGTISTYTSSIDSYSDDYTTGTYIQDVIDNRIDLGSALDGVRVRVDIEGDVTVNSRPIAMWREPIVSYSSPLWTILEGPLHHEIGETVRVEYRVTDDDPAGTPVWTAWAPFVAGLYDLRSIQFRFTLISFNQFWIVPHVTAIHYRIYQP